MPIKKNLLIPEAIAGLQINFCKKPQCRNFGIPPEGHQDTYRYIEQDSQRHALQCKSCGRVTILKSNHSVVHERERLSYKIPQPQVLCCPNQQCPNHFLQVSLNPKQFHKFGTTAAGQPRYRCKSCKKTFSCPKSTGRRHRRPELNERIYLALVNKIPINRICEIENVQPKTVYDKLNFLYESCLKFSAIKEQQLNDQKDHSFFLATDTLNFHLNWQRSRQRKNVCLQTVTTTDIPSGYVLACHGNINFDYELKKIERELRESYQTIRPPVFRPYAHFLLNKDYGRSLEASEEPNRNNLLDDVEHKYREMITRQDFGVAEVLNRYTSPPSEGVQVRFDYTLYGHFAWMKEVLPKHSEKVFYIAYDSSLREACLSLFSEQIINNKTHAFYVRTEHGLSIASKRQRIREANDVLREYQQRAPESDAESIELGIIKDRMNHMPVIGHWGDRWLIHPHPHMGEPGKAVSHTSDTGKADQEKLAEYYRKASLYPSRHFYDRLQNRISVVPEHNETGPTGQWNLYGAYKPSVVIKLIEIFRTYNNYVLTDKYGQTPAQRLGLTSGVLTIKDIIGVDP